MFIARLGILFHTLHDLTESGEGEGTVENTQKAIFQAGFQSQSGQR